MERIFPHSDLSLSMLNSKIHLHLFAYAAKHNSWGSAKYATTISYQNMSSNWDLLLNVTKFY